MSDEGREPQVPQLDSYLAGVRLLQDPESRPYAIAADAALMVLAIDVGIRQGIALGPRDGVTWGLGLAAIAVLVLGTQFRRYRLRISAVAGQLRLAAALVTGAGALAWLGPRAWIGIAAVGLAGCVKFARELVVYVRLRRRMRELGKRRRINLTMIVLYLLGLGIGGIAAYVQIAAEEPGASAGAAMWLAAFSLFSAAMEVFG